MAEVITQFAYIDRVLQVNESESQPATGQWQNSAENMQSIGWFSNRTGMSVGDGKAHGKD